MTTSIRTFSPTESYNAGDIVLNNNNETWVVTGSGSNVSFQPLNKWSPLTTTTTNTININSGSGMSWAIEIDESKYLSVDKINKVCENNPALKKAYDNFKLLYDLFQNEAEYDK